MVIKKVSQHIAALKMALMGIIIAGMYLLPVSPIVGAWAAFFSCKTLFFPLIGAFAGIGGSLLVTGMRLLVRSLWGAALDLHILAHFLPGLASSLAWATRSAWLHVGLPALCMFFFVVHPVGAHVWYYSFYWLIPMGLYWYGAQSVFARALISTYLAHAVGSVIWLYTVPMGAVAWKTLIPVVACERLVFAAGMSLGYYLLTWCMPALRIGVARLGHALCVTKNN